MRAGRGTGNDFDYTFTDRELADVLGYMVRAIGQLGVICEAETPPGA